MSLVYLSLDELEALAWEYRALGVSVLAAGDEWHLTVPIKGVQTVFRAHKPAVAEVTR